MRLLRSVFTLVEFVRGYLSTEGLGNAFEKLGKLSNPYLTGPAQQPDLNSVAYKPLLGFNGGSTILCLLSPTKSFSLILCFATMSLSPGSNIEFLLAGISYYDLFRFRSRFSHKDVKIYVKGRPPISEPSQIIGPLRAFSLASGR